MDRGSPAELTVIVTYYSALPVIDGSNYAHDVTIQLALWFVQEQGESAEFTGVNEHFPGSDWTK